MFFFSFLITFSTDIQKDKNMKTLKQVKRLVVIVIGFTMLAAGMAMIVLPGPAFVFIPAGLAVLATEFLWARKLLQKVKDKLRRDKGIKEEPSVKDHK